MIPYIKLLLDKAYILWNTFASAFLFKKLCVQTQIFARSTSVFGEIIFCP